MTDTLSPSGHPTRGRRMRQALVGGIAVLTITGALGLGATAAASGPGDGLGSTPERAARICNNLDAIKDWINSRIAEVHHRIEYFTTMKAKAEAMGRTELVARIDNAIAKLNDRLARLEARLAKLDEWASTHCDPSGGPTTTEPSTTEPSAG